MRELQQLPKEFKVLQADETHDKPDGRYIMPQPFIRNYFFEITVNVTDREERVTVRLVNRIGKKFKNVTRYLTWIEAMMVKDLFWDGFERVVQVMGVNEDEEQAGNYFNHLIKAGGGLEDDLKQTKAGYECLEEAYRRLEKENESLKERIPSNPSVTV